MTQALHKTLPETSFFFPQGLIGFHHIKDISFKFFKTYKGKPLYYFSSLINADIGWIVIEHTSLPLKPLDDQSHFVFYTIKFSSLTEKIMVANLTTSLHIHKVTGQGTQLIHHPNQETLELGPISDFL